MSTDQGIDTLVERLREWAAQKRWDGPSDVLLIKAADALQAEVERREAVEAERDRLAAHIRKLQEGPDYQYERHMEQCAHGSTLWKLDQAHARVSELERVLGEAKDALRAADQELERLAGVVAFSDYDAELVADLQGRIRALLSDTEESSPEKRAPCPCGDPVEGPPCTHSQPCPYAEDEPPEAWTVHDTAPEPSPGEAGEAGCEDCGGTGRRLDDRGAFLVLAGGYVACPYCEGTGTKPPQDSAERCNGSGTIPSDDPHLTQAGVTREPCPGCPDCNPEHPQSEQAGEDWPDAIYRVQVDRLLNPAAIHFGPEVGDIERVAEGWRESGAGVRRYVPADMPDALEKFRAWLRDEIEHMADMDARKDLTEVGQWRLKALRDVTERLPASVPADQNRERRHV